MPRGPEPSTWTGRMLAGLRELDRVERIPPIAKWDVPLLDRIRRAAAWLTRRKQAAYRRRYRAEIGPVRKVMREIARKGA